MHIGLQTAAIIAVSVVAAIVYVHAGVRAGPRTAWGLSRFTIACVALVLATLVFFSVASPVVAYGIICVALVSGNLFDQVLKEHARRRRVASLTPRPAAEAVPTVWVAITVASVLILAPYVILGQQRVAALMVGICALVMAGISWRIASAPVQLKGEDIQSERLRDRASRSRNAGMSAVLAIGSIMVFTAFVNVGLPTILPLQRILYLVSLVTWAGLWVWVILYSRHFSGLSRSVS